MRTLAACAIAAALLLVAGCADPPQRADPPERPSAGRIFLARKVLTMETDRPEVTAVGVVDGRISAVGDLDSVREALGNRPIEVDRTLADKVLLPGFIDPHMHPSIAAGILPLHIVSAMEWQTPRGRTTALRDRDAFFGALRDLDGDLPPGEWLVAWGYHRPYHGALSRDDLDAVSTERPIVIWQRSVHEMFFNTKALEALAYTEAQFERSPHADWARGHVYESGLFAVAGSMLARVASPESYAAGLAMMSEVLHRGGITTVGEQGFPQIDEQLELALLTAELAKDVPYRFVLVPNAMYLLPRLGSADAAERAASEMLAKSTDRIRFVKHVKYYVDGAMFSPLMQMSEPYLDGHTGAWMMAPEQQRAVLDEFWDAGWQIHLHVNGDAGLDLALAMIAERRELAPRDDVRVVLEHYGYARDDQHARVAELGAAVSNNAWYLYELAPPYAEQGLGPARAADLSPLGGLARAGVPFSFHSDFFMAPAEPLTQVWVAVNRIASDGRVWGPEQKVPVGLALRAITIEAAWSLGLEDEIGSIAVGKRADFTVLERDPTAVPPEEIRDIPIWGTVFQGRAYPIGD